MFKVDKEYTGREIVVKITLTHSQFDDRFVLFPGEKDEPACFGGNWLSREDLIQLRNTINEYLDE